MSKLKSVKTTTPSLMETSLIEKVHRFLFPSCCLSEKTLRRLERIVKYSPDLRSLKIGWGTTVTEMEFYPDEDMLNLPVWADIKHIRTKGFNEWIVSHPSVSWTTREKILIDAISKFCNKWEIESKTNKDLAQYIKTE